MHHICFDEKLKSILINGRGQFNCSLAAQFSNNTSLPMCTFKEGDQCAPQILHVEPNKTYRIRLSSTTALASLNLAVQVFTFFPFYFISPFSLFSRKFSN